VTCDAVPEKYVNETYRVGNVVLKVPLRKCKICGREFKLPYKDGSYIDDNGNRVSISVRGPSVVKYGYYGTDYYCSDACSQEHDRRTSAANSKRWIEEEKQRKEKDAKRKREKRAQDRLSRPDNICVQCGKAFRPVRKDAKFCSDACKQAEYRERKNN